MRVACLPWVNTRPWDGMPGLGQRRRGVVQPPGGLRAPPPYWTRGPRHCPGAAGEPPRYLRLEILWLFYRPVGIFIIYSLIVSYFIVYLLILLKCLLPYCLLLIACTSHSSLYNTFAPYVNRITKLNPMLCKFAYYCVIVFLVLVLIFRLHRRPIEEMPAAKLLICACKQKAESVSVMICLFLWIGKLAKKKLKSCWFGRLFISLEFTRPWLHLLIWNP